MFSGPETASVLETESVFPNVPVNKYFVIYQVSKKTRKTRKLHKFRSITFQFHHSPANKSILHQETVGFHGSCDTLSSNEMQECTNFDT